MRTRLALLAALLLSCHPWTMRPCLSGNNPRALETRLAWEASSSDRLPWRERVCATEQVLWGFHHDGALAAPACPAELSYELDLRIFRSDPIEYDRMQVARVVALARLDDVRDVMPDKAEVLIRLSELRDDQMEAYGLAPEEKGPPPPREWFRQLALDGMVRSNLFSNVLAAREYELARRANARNDLERRILYPALKNDLEFADAADRGATSRGEPLPASRSAAAARLDLVLREVKGALDAPYEPLSFDLLVDHIALLGTFAKHFDRAESTRRLLDALLASKAEVAACANHPAARRDLYVAAALARFDSDWDLSAFFADAAPFPERERFDWRAAFEAPLYQRGVNCTFAPDTPPIGQCGMALEGVHTWTITDTVISRTLQRASAAFTLEERGIANSRALTALCEQPDAIERLPEARDFVLTYVARAYQLDRVRGIGRAAALDDDTMKLTYRAIGAALRSDGRAVGRAEGVLRAMLADVKGGQIPEDDASLVRAVQILGYYADAFGLTSEVTAALPALMAVPQSVSDRRQGYPPRFPRAAVAARAAMEIAASRRAELHR